MQKRIFNLTATKEKRRVLRNHAPEAERLLWVRLRNEQVAGLRFRRQYSVGAFVLDFYCPELKLAIEVDGATHDSKDAQQYDSNRQAWIEQFSVRFLRFTNFQIHHQIEHVVETIENTAKQLRPKI